MIRIFLFTLLVSSFASASSVQDTGTIKNVYFHSHDTVHAATWKGTLQVEIESLSWSDTDSTCNTRYVVVRPNDTHLISAILAAKMASQPVTVYANEDLKLSGTSYCYLRAVGV